jgi:5-amino-6-(5-phosphoribosylamino)uracil reductase
MSDFAAGAIPASVTAAQLPSHEANGEASRNRPHTTVVLAMSADGKIADARRSPPQFGSDRDYAHLEEQVSLADGVLFGGTTLRSGGTAMRVRQPHRLQYRRDAGKPEQPVQIVCSRSGSLDPDLRFFRQAVPRWLVTTSAGVALWQDRKGFEQILNFEPPFETPSGAQLFQTQSIDWLAAFAEFHRQGLERIAVLGGGELIATLLAHNLIDEIWLTVCPLLLGGNQSPTPVSGEGFLEATAPRLTLLSAETVNQEVYLHYQVQNLTRSN